MVGRGEPRRPGRELEPRVWADQGLGCGRSGAALVPVCSPNPVQGPGRKNWTSRRGPALPVRVLQLQAALWCGVVRPRPRCILGEKNLGRLFVGKRIAVTKCASAAAKWKNASSAAAQEATTSTEPKTRKKATYPRLPPRRKYQVPPPLLGAAKARRGASGSRGWE